MLKLKSNESYYHPYANLSSMGSDFHRYGYWNLGCSSCLPLEFTMKDVSQNPPSLLCCSPDSVYVDAILQLVVLLVVFCYFAEAIIRMELFYLEVLLAAMNQGFLIEKVYLNYYYFS